MDTLKAKLRPMFVAKESRTIGGFGRSDHFAYTHRFGGLGEVAARGLLEAGAASGREPIGAEYEAQCRTLCYRPYPSWAEV